MKNDNVKAIVVLFAFCLVVTLALASVNLITAPIIEANNKNAQTEAVDGLIEGASFEAVDMATLEGLPKSITSVFKDKNGKGIAVTFAISGYTSDGMKFAVGVTSDGKISGVKEISYMDSKDFGDDYPQSFIGKGGDELSSVANVSGVTVSSLAFKNALKDVFATAKLLGVEVGEEIVDESNKYFEYANGLIEGAKLVKVEDLEGLPETITSVYRDLHRKGIVVTFAISSRPGSMPMEYAVALSFDGKVIATRQIAYYEGYNINGYPLDFVGKTEQEVNELPLYAGVTSSSTTFKNGMKDTFKALAAVKLQDVSGVIDGSDLEEITDLKDLPETITSVYEDKNGNGIVVTFAVSTYEGREPLQYAVALSLDGKITGVKEIVFAEYYPFGDYPNTYIGKNETETGNADALAGVTSSSTYFKNAMKDTFKALEAYKEANK